MVETLRTLAQAGITRAGAGFNAAEAASPAALDVPGVPGKGRVLVFAVGEPDSGIPSAWAAAEQRAGRLVECG